MKHYIDIYINLKLKELKVLDIELSDKANMSKGQISKLKNGLTNRLTAKTYYSIIKAFNDTVSNSTKIVYPNQNFEMKSWQPKKRNSFGAYLLQFEISKNSVEEIAAKTGINETRINELYFKNGALEAYELILIEKALGLKSGELFEKVYGNLQILGRNNKFKDAQASFFMWLREIVIEYGNYFIGLEDCLRLSYYKC